MSGKAEVLKLLALVNKATQDALDAYEASGESVQSLSSMDEPSLLAMSDSVALKKAIRLLEGACEQLCATLAPPGHTVINRAHVYDTDCLRVAIRAGVADMLHAHPEGLHVKAPACNVDLEPSRLGRILRVLANRHCFQEVDVNVFANNRLSLVLRTSEPMSHLADIYSTEMQKGANVLYEVLSDPRCGRSGDMAKAPFMYAVNGPENEGTMFFDWLRSTPDRQETFNTSMTGIGTLVGSLTSLQGYPWDSVSTVCDLGAGVAAYAMTLIRANPHLRFTLCDLPATVDQAREVWASGYPEAVQSEGIVFYSLDFFERPPPANQDIYYMRSILHNWPDEQALVILRNISRAMSPTSRVLIHDYLVLYLNRPKSANMGDGSQRWVDPAPEPMLPNFGAGKRRTYNQDMCMLFACNAKERTFENITALGRRAGLCLVKVWDLGESNVLEFELMKT